MLIVVLVGCGSAPFTAMCLGCQKDSVHGCCTPQSSVQMNCCTRQYDTQAGAPRSHGDAAVQAAWVRAEFVTDRVFPDAANAEFDQYPHGPQAPSIVLRT